MTQEDKEILLKDLSARLSYGVKVTTTNPAAGFGVISGISIKSKITVSTKDADIVFECPEVKPYLRPMSSMTDEEREEYQKFLFPCPDYNGKVVIGVYHRDLDKVYDWLNAHHFDYRGLINKGLAIEVTEDNNPYKN